VRDWPAGQHLAELYDALYSSLGEGAPRASNDAFVVRLHEASRTFGTLALEVRDGDDVTPDALVSALMGNSLAEDPTGALTLYALAMVIGPRLLVTLRDYLEVETDEARREVLSHGSDLVVREIGAVAATVAAFEPLDDPAWAHAARALVEVLDGAGMAESFGQRP
jgi:hypothetical protein